MPFEELVYKVTSCVELAYPFMDLLQAKVDVEPVSPEELTRESIRRYEAIVLARTDWLTAGHAALLADYVKDGGKLILDQPSAKSLALPGATDLDFAIGGTWLPDYAKPDNLTKLREALRPLLSPADDCDQPLVTLRRFEGEGGGRYLWVNDNQTGAEYMGMREALKAGKVSARAEEAGFGKTNVTTRIRRADDGSVPFDVLAGKPLAVTRAAGSMVFDVALPRW
ncbi:MAG: hypothetical protein HYU66_22705 [Armatimonadetes bacterium]|nr:hypothetical protein [Armatimonadota bacterium]